MIKNPYFRERIAFTLLFIATAIVVLPVICILFFIVKEGWHAISWEFLSQMPRKGMREGGIFPAIVGTLYLVFGTLVFALPLGILSAIYLSEYAKDNFLTRMVKLAIINLAGVPSVVYGLFGLGIFVVFLKFGSSLLAGSMTLAIMVLPIIITTTREALDSVPQSFRQVSYSLGVSKWDTIRHVVLPHALPGILTGMILAVSRAAGETAPILFTVAAFYLPRLPKSIFDQAMALPYHLYVISTQVPNIKLEVRYGTALVLLMIVLSLNLIAIIVRAHFRKKRKW
ncbi:MAG: phosphate ABC transporter permease PstA [Candidatus Omnitrophica bacterium]|nr:phosphate ABC transporter permease PstA [Candidatus Omnitrophota bacterium]